MFYILAAIFLWSSLGIVIKLSGMPVHLLMFFSCIISVALIGLILTKKGFRQYMPKRRGVLHLFVLGLISLINTFAFFYAYKKYICCQCCFDPLYRACDGCIPCTDIFKRETDHQGIDSRCSGHCRFMDYVRCFCKPVFQSCGCRR